MDISNLLINQQKFVLIVDNIGNEPRLQQLLHKLVRQTQTPLIEIPEYVRIDPSTAFSTDSGPLEFPLPAISEKSNVQLKPISKLIIDYEVPTIFQTVQKLRKNPNVKQIFAVATTKNIQEQFVVPYLEHLADLVVTFLDLKHLRILAKKSGGLVANKLYNFQITNEEIFVKETAKTPVKQPEEPTIDPETLGTFKIGKLGKQEQLAKDALQLPYEKINKSSGDKSEGVKESRVIYVPDADDDIDPEEEDPDDDLYV